MEELWREIEARFGERAIDASKIVPLIHIQRGVNLGFGVIRLN